MAMNLGDLHQLPLEATRELQVAGKSLQLKCSGAALLSDVAPGFCGWHRLLVRCGLRPLGLRSLVIGASLDTLRRLGLWSHWIK